MFVGKSVYLALGFSFLMGLLIVGCTGDKGPQGPLGYEGPEGPPGRSDSVLAIADRVFGIMLTNGSESDFQGALKVHLTSDSLRTANDTLVVARRVFHAPVIDGVDGGAAEWSLATPASISLHNIAGRDLGIDSAAVRAAYDDKYVYMQFVWTEATTGTFVAAPDTTKNMWTMIVEPRDIVWRQSGGEDKLYLAWELTRISDWASRGAATIFDGSTFRTPAEAEVADLWGWQSTETYYSGHLADKVVRYAASGDASSLDVGSDTLGFVKPNIASQGRPTYMNVSQSVKGSAYPLMSFEAATFDTTRKWARGATIPGYLYYVPAGSSADVETEAVFSNGAWTVELRRLRQTGNSDDSAF